MELLAVLLAAMLAVASGGATPPVTTDARANIIDIGAQAQSTETPPDDTDARSHIIDLGNE
ncbi:MAG TPA: hypothetical protein VGC87_01545 [Pyrinomonadaceae bacterium]|jgi:hypothetical protein